MRGATWTTKDGGGQGSAGAAQRRRHIAGVKEALANSKGEKKDGVAAMLGVTAEEGRGQLK